MTRYPHDEPRDRVILYGRERDTRGIAEAAGWTRQPGQTRWGLGRADRPGEWIMTAYDGSWQHARSVETDGVTRTEMLAEGPDADSLATHLARTASVRVIVISHDSESWLWVDANASDVQPTGEIISLMGRAYERLAPVAAGRFRFAQAFRPVRDS